MPVEGSAAPGTGIRLRRNPQCKLSIQKTLATRAAAPPDLIYLPWGAAQASVFTNDSAGPTFENRSFVSSTAGSCGFKLANILIVEDEANLRRLFALVLRQEGHTVLEAYTVHEAEQVSTGRAIDVLIADIVLPGAKSGTDFAVGLIESQPRLRVLFVSGWLEQREHDAQNVAKMPEGSYVVLQKPFTMDVLVQHVRAFVNAMRWRTA